MNTTNKQLVWLGAGYAEQPAFSFSDFDSVILVEARKECCDVLSNTYISQNISVLNVAVGNQAAKEPASFIKYSLEEYSAYSEATGLRRLFPGIKALDKETIKCTSVRDIFSGLKLADFENSLIIEIPDQLTYILRELAESGLLSVFTTVTVLYSEQALYEGMQPLESIFSLFDENFFDLSCVEGDDPDIQFYKFQFNESRQKVFDLEAQVSSLRQSLNTSENSMLKIEQEFDFHKKETSEKIAELEKQKINSEAQLESRLTAVQNQIEKTTLELNKKKNELEEVLKKNNLLKIKLTESDEKYESIAKQVKKIEEEKAADDRAFTELEKSYQEEIKIGNNLKKDLTESESRYQQLSEKNAEQQAKLQSSIKEAKQQAALIAKLEAELREANEKIQTISEELSACRVSVSRLKNENLEYKTRVDEKTSDCAVIQQKLDDAVIKKSYVESEVPKLKAQVELLQEIMTFEFRQKK